jgi:hypothetical protein
MIEPNDELLVRYRDWFRTLTNQTTSPHFIMPYNPSNSQRGAASSISNRFSELIPMAATLGVEIPEYEKDVKSLREKPLGNGQLGDILVSVSQRYFTFRGAILKKLQEKIESLGGWS